QQPAKSRSSKSAPHTRALGDAAVTNELQEVAKNSGLQVALTFHHKEIPGRNLVQLELDATVNGNYKAVVQFLNGLQRSKSIYIIYTLGLASEPTAQPAAAGALRAA